MIKFRFTIPASETLRQWLEGDGEPIALDLDKMQSCNGKLKHKDLSSAVKAAISYSRKKGIQYQGYKCRHCEAWHIGHKSEDPR